MSNIIIFGASRGLGAAFATGLPKKGDNVWLVSRKKPLFLEETLEFVNFNWIQADLTEASAASTISKAVGAQPIHLLLYNAGIWESKAFTKEYDFESVDPLENHRVLTVNLSAAIDCIQMLLPNVRKAEHGKIVVIGSTSGVENVGGHEVAYSASKFGVRGLVHALREITRPDGIPVTCINPGTIATEIKLEDESEQLKDYDGRWGLPVGDLVKLVETLMALSPFSCVKEITIPAINDTHA